MIIDISKEKNKSKKQMFIFKIEPIPIKIFEMVL